MSNIQRWFMIMAMWVVIIFMVFAFYWVLVRPVGIRRMCAKKARQVSTGTKSGLDNMLEINRAVY